jgi:hypothetical protein
MTERAPIDTLQALAAFMGLYGFTIYEAVSLLRMPAWDVTPILRQMLRKKLIADTGLERALGGGRSRPIYVPFSHAPLGDAHA